MPSPGSLIIITVVAFIVLLAMGLKRPVWAMVGYMILVYCKISSYYPAFAAFQAELVFAILILIRIFVSSNSLSRLYFSYNSVNKYLFFFVASVFLSFSIAWDHQYSWDNAVYPFIKTLVLFLMIMLSVNDIKDLKIFIWSFIIMFAYLAYEPLYGFLMGTGGSQHIYGINYIADIGLLSGHVALANNMNQMIPIAFYLIFSFEKKTARILTSIPVVFFVVALIGSGSRGGAIGFIFFSFCLVYFSKKRVKAGFVVGILCFILFATSGHLSHTIDRIDSRSTKGRLTGLTHGIEMVKRGNILGVGPGCFLFARGRYFGYTMESHNIYGQVLGDLGIPGTIAWFFLIRQIFLNIIASKKRLKELALDNHFLYKLAMGIQVSLIVRLFICMASHALYYFYWYTMAAISISILKIVENMEEDTLKEVEEK